MIDASVRHDFPNRISMYWNKIAQITRHYHDVIWKVQVYITVFQRKTDHSENNQVFLTICIVGWFCKATEFIAVNSKCFSEAIMKIFLFCSVHYILRPLLFSRQWYYVISKYKTSRQDLELIFLIFKDLCQKENKEKREIGNSRKHWCNR